LKDSWPPAFFSPEGELIQEVKTANIKLDEVGAMANDILLKAQKSTEIMGVGRGKMVHIEAPKAHILVRCLNESTDFSQTTTGRAHIHMVVIIEKEGGFAMAKMKLASIIQDLAPLFR
jgi:predicted regulator of Ras-like GTPase activity (Roadblock/LC7/MglB family)